MEKKLPFIFPPIIDIYSGDAGIVAIQQTQKESMGLILKNHFMIMYDYELAAPGFDWNEMVDPVISIPLQNEISRKGLIQTIIDEINNDKYIHIVIDHYYLKNSGRFHRFHFTHDVATIYGYDLTKSCFYIADNFSIGKYDVIEVGFDELIESRIGIEDETIDSMTLNDDMKIKFELSEILEQIYYYQEGMSSMGKYIPSCLYGISIYDFLGQLVKQTIEEADGYDIRPFQIVLNHLKVCLCLCDYLEQEYSINNEDIKECKNKFDGLYMNMLESRNLYIKLNITKKPQIANDIINRMKLIKENENLLLSKLRAVLTEI